MVPKVLLCFLAIGTVLAVNWPSTTQCTDFCAGYIMNCSSTYDIYQTQAACEAECSRFPLTTTCASLGDGCIEAASENSYDCRLYHLMVASNGVAGNLATHCPHATPLSSAAEDGAPNSGPCLDAPGATDQPLSGTIQDLCNNLVATCGTLFGAPTLTMQYCYNALYFVADITTLTGYPTDGAMTGFPVAPVSNSDSFICRRYHVDVAGTSPSNAVTHCPHAFVGDDQCGSNCDFYCDVVNGACTGANEQYASTNECMTACNAMDTADWEAALPTAGNTLNCRIYHATVAAQSSALADVHCEHAGEISTSDTCGEDDSAAFTAGASLFLVALLAFFSLN